jgi:hypothetical protein
MAPPSLDDPGGKPLSASNFAPMPNAACFIRNDDDAVRRLE